MLSLRPLKTRTGESLARCVVHCHRGFVIGNCGCGAGMQRRIYRARDHDDRFRVRDRVHDRGRVRLRVCDCAHGGRGGHGGRHGRVHDDRSHVNARVRDHGHGHGHVHLRVCDRVHVPNMHDRDHVGDHRGRARAHVRVHPSFKSPCEKNLLKSLV